MAYSRLDLGQIKIAMEKPVDRACRQVALELVQEKVEAGKEALLETFEESPITQEIEQGEHGEGGSLPSSALGNLFSYIGFEAGSTPVEDLRELLETGITVRPRPELRNGRYIFTVDVPSKAEIKAATPMPWGTASSWVYALEAGVAGLNRYLSIERANAYDEATKRKRQREGFNEEYSRSTTAIQSKRIVSGGENIFKANSYITDMLKDLKRTLQG